MNILEMLLSRRRLILTLAFSISLVGVLSWNTMVRQEDPTMPDYWGQIIVSFPGMPADKVERLVLEPIEDHLAEVEGISWVEASAFDEMVTLFIELRQDVKDTDMVWDDVREALDGARREFPDGVSLPLLNDEVGRQQESVVLALTGSPDPLILLDAARALKRELLSVDQVGLVKIVADPGEQVRVELDPIVARSFGLTIPELVAQLGARNRIVPGGSLQLGEKTVRLRPLSDFASVSEIENTMIMLASGNAVPLSEIASVTRSGKEPVGSLMRYNSEMAVGLGIIAKKGTNLVSYGEAVRKVIDGQRPNLAPIEINEIAFQPGRVSTRIDDLGQSLLLGIFIVAGVVILAMGLRLGLLVASVVPLVAMASLAIYAFGGGVLHQISIAALVLALGMLVDNAIVVAENVQYRLDRGESQHDAAVNAVRELAVPLAAATLTTLAAFVPMLLSEGSTAHFTKAIPILIMMTLSVSYGFAILVTPVLSEMFLVKRKKERAWSAKFAGLLSGFAIRKPIVVVMLAAILVTLSIAASSLIQLQFFPAADRNQLVVDLKLPEGTHLETTARTSRQLETFLRDRGDVVSVSSFMGRSAPKFYYNLKRTPWSPHFAQIIVETISVKEIPAVLLAVRSFAKDQMAGVEVIPRRLEQGPPVDAPVEIRLFGYDLDDLNDAANLVVKELREIPGTLDVRHDLSPGAPTLEFEINDAQAARYGITRSDISLALYGHTRGLPVGELYDGEDPVPVVVRSPAGEGALTDEVMVLDITRPNGRTVPLAQVAEIDAVWRPAVIKHRNRQRFVTVSSQLEEGSTFSNVNLALKPRLAALVLPEGVSLGLGGDIEGSGEANAAMVRTLPIGVMLLLGVLLAEFNSFRRVAIVLVTVPLAAAGVIPGLLINQQPFGFMSMLGVIALVGIVVNNAIVLLEVVESRRRDGAPIDEALSDAVAQRIRPILLTTATTVAGLLPLALSSSTLWPPLASAMISGLLASTMLTLLVVPAMYRLLFAREARIPSRPLVQTAAILSLFVAFNVSAELPTLTLEQSMRMAVDRPDAQAVLLDAEAVAQTALAERRASFLPSIGASFHASDRNRDLELDTPLGSFELGRSRANSAGIEVAQPLFDPSRHLYANDASRKFASAARGRAERTRQIIAAESGHAHLWVLELEARARSIDAFVKSLSSRLREVQAMVDGGRALKADALKILLALEQAELDLVALQEGRSVAIDDYMRAVGLEEATQPVLPASWQNRPAPGISDLVERALVSRADVRALTDRAEALGLRRSAVRAEALPQLGARLSWSWSDGSPYTVDHWAEGALTLNWSVFASGTRAPRVRALEARKEAVIHNLEQLERSITVEIRSAMATLTTARDAVSVSERAVEYATENLRIERERYLSGRTTTNDLITAETELKEQRMRYEVAGLIVIRSWIDLWLATGERDLNGLFG